MSNITLPIIAHATVTLNERNRVVIQMHEGWVYWDRNHYEDNDGNIITPEADEMQYFRYGVYSPTTDFDNRIVVVAESDVSENQICGTKPIPPTVTE